MWIFFDSKKCVYPFESRPLNSLLVHCLNFSFSFHIVYAWPLQPGSPLKVQAWSSRWVSRWFFNPIQPDSSTEAWCGPVLNPFLVPSLSPQQLLETASDLSSVGCYQVGLLTPLMATKKSLTPLLLLKSGSLVSRFLCALYFISYKWKFLLGTAIFMCSCVLGINFFLAWFRQLRTLLWSNWKGDLRSHEVV